MPDPGIDGPPNPDGGILPLQGFTVAVTAARRRDELTSLLERRGACVVSAPAIRIVPVADDAELVAATKACVAEPPDIAVATTGIGFRGWVEAADGAGMGEALLDVLGRAELLARGPKARGAVRAAGLPDPWSPASESSTEVLEQLLTRDLTGLRIAVQLHGEPLPDFVEALEVAGASVVQVPVYRWMLPADVAPLRRLVESIPARAVDAVTFTSAPAVASLLTVAREAGTLDAVLDALQHDVLAACVGPVTAAPLDRLGIPTVQPARARLGALVREVVAQLPARRSRVLPVAGHRLELRGYGVLVDERLVTPAPAALAVLRTLASQPGRVFSRHALLGCLPGGGADEHAVEMAVTRLRSALGDPKLVQTVLKRGYRLSFDPGQGPDCHEHEEEAE